MVAYLRALLPAYAIKLMPILKKLFIKGISMKDAALHLYSGGLEVLKAHVLPCIILYYGVGVGDLVTKIGIGF